LQYVTGIPNLPELIGWLNGIVPGAESWIDESALVRKMTWGFTAALDEGVRFPASGGEGLRYTVELRPHGSAAPSGSWPSRLRRR
jgi:hypothetical protein